MPSNDVEEIKRRLDMVELVSAYVKLRPSGKKFVGLCPFHQEKTPSFHVDPDKRLWYCYGCGVGGDAFKFLEKAEGLSFLEVLERLAQKTGVALQTSGAAREAASERDRLIRANDAAAAFYKARLTEASPAAAYLRSRGIGLDVAARFQLGYAPPGWKNLKQALLGAGHSEADLLLAGLLSKSDQGSTYDRFRERLIFPIADADNRTIAFGGRVLGEGEPKYLNSPESPLFHKGRTVYGLAWGRKAIQERKTALVVEGYMDVIALHRHGFDHAVAPLGTSLTSDQARLLGRLADSVALVFDADTAGLNAALRALPVFEEADVEVEVRVVVLPVGEDPDSLLCAGGVPAFDACLSDGRPVLDYHREALIRQHGSETLEARRRVVREAIGPLARVRTHPEPAFLTRAIMRLAEFWCAGQPERLPSAQEEIRRAMATAGRDKATVRHEPDGRPAPPRQLSWTALRGMDRAQAEVLRAALDDRRLAEITFEQLSPKEFPSPRFAGLAAVLQGHLQDPVWEPAAWSLDDETAASLIAELATNPAPPLSEPGLQDCLARLKAWCLKEQLRTLQKKLLEGQQLDRDELSTYNTLARQFHA